MKKLLGIRKPAATAITIGPWPEIAMLTFCWVLMQIVEVKEKQLTASWARMCTCLFQIGQTPQEYHFWKRTSRLAFLLTPDSFILPGIILVFLTVYQLAAHRSELKQLNRNSKVRPIFSLCDWFCIGVSLQTFPTDVFQAVASKEEWAIHSWQLGRRRKVDWKHECQTAHEASGTPLAFTLGCAVVWKFYLGSYAGFTLFLWASYILSSGSLLGSLPSRG
jgi:hypothetical protein